jgi:hypothetical protein
MIKVIKQGSSPIGKSASNELIKLNATFMNNLAVGLIVTGFLIPFISLYAKFGLAYNEAFEASKSIWDYVHVEFSMKTVRAFLNSSPIVLAVGLGILCKFIANRLIAGLED